MNSYKFLVGWLDVPSTQTDQVGEGQSNQVQDLDREAQARKQGAE
jgi:hypothetical protein